MIAVRIYKQGLYQFSERYAEAAAELRMSEGEYTPRAITVRTFMDKFGAFDVNKYILFVGGKQNPNEKDVGNFARKRNQYNEKVDKALYGGRLEICFKCRYFSAGFCAVSKEYVRKTAQLESFECRKRKRDD